MGQNKVGVGDHVTLSCSSTSTSQPAAFRGFPKMTYEWFENGTSISLGKVLRLKVENSSYNKIITCRAKEKLLSELSDPVQIEKPFCKYTIHHMHVSVYNKLKVIHILLRGPFKLISGLFGKYLEKSLILFPTSENIS